MDELQLQAQLATSKLQANAPQTYGLFDPITIITLFTTLYPVLIKLFQSCKSPTSIAGLGAGIMPTQEQTAIDFINEHHDVQNGYDWVVLGPATTQTLRHARELRRQHGGPTITRAHARDLASAALDNVLDMSATQYSVVCQLCGVAA